MVRSSYSLFSEGTEDRLGEADSLDEAVRMAQVLAQEGTSDDPISIEHGGRVVRQLVRTPGGAVQVVTGE
jgi:hypothetical protein